MSLSNKEFLLLQKEWYAKLAATGFVDIETSIGEEQELIQSAAYLYRYNPSDVERENKQLYFEQLSQRVSQETFRNEVDLVILTKRAEGMKIKEIVEELKRLGFNRDRATVRFTIRKYENAWGIRRWTPEQLTVHLKKKQHDDTDPK